MEHNMNSVWLKNKVDGLNQTIGFYLDLGETCKFELKLAAGPIFKIYLDSQMVYFGPMRSAHGYSRIHELSFKARRIVIVINHPGIKTFSFLNEEPFLSCELKTNKMVYTQDDFKAYLLTERDNKVLRYSFQRGFSESYHVRGEFNELLNGTLSNEEKLSRVNTPKLIKKYTHDPILDKIYPIGIIKSGFINQECINQIPYQRYFEMAGKEIDGFSLEDLDINLIKEYLSFNHSDGESNIKYQRYEFDKSRTGFINLEVKVNQPSSIYLAYDEILDDKGDINVLRNETLNVIKWEITKPGIYRLSSFEPYTYHFVEIIYDINNIIDDMFIIEYCNPDVANYKLDTNDEDLNLIIEAAKESFRSNAVDLLTDCPSRERSGWLSDSYFSGEAEKILTGETLVEQAFLENYALYEDSIIPKGMIPMNYPSDAYDDTYIPNWSMWYIMEVIRFAESGGNSEIVNKSYVKVMNLFKFFEGYENEYHLLENLDSWVFVEWSKANDKTHTCGVNIPTNITYQKILSLAGNLYQKEEWIKKSKIIKDNIIKLAFDGTLFVDNLVRDNNKLIKTSNYTEVCQYYAFWFDLINKDDYYNLYDLLMNHLGKNKQIGFMEYVEKPNMMYGIYMRLDLLMRDHKKEELLDEIKYYFLPMAKKTGTLWEHTFDTCSLNHAFASYCIKWIKYCLEEE